MCTKGADNKRKIILHTTAGSAVQGDMIGILGPSGAGKSTMLDALTMRQTKSSCAVTVDGVALPRNIFQGLTAYVPQVSHRLARR